MAGLLLSLATLGSPLLAAPAPVAAPVQTENQMQAEYLVNFLRFTQWPERTFHQPDAPYVIAVIGDKGVADAVRAAATAAGRIGRRSVEVRWIESGRGTRAAPFDSAQDRENLLQLKRSHLVLFHSSAGAVPWQALSDLWGQPVLTVSDVPGFVRSGGMIGLVTGSGHVEFEANPVAIRNARLKLSAKVLKLARTERSSPR